jgi:CHAD domain-containing protein
MARAADVPLDGREPYAAAAARVVRVRAGELLRHSEGVLDTGDIERVHDMRVASRRLRAVLEVFAPCFPRRLHKSVLSDVRALADALGERRDPDVHIDALERLLDRFPEDMRAGLEHLAGVFRERQARGNELLAAELDRIASTDLSGRLEELAAAAESTARKP